MFAVSATKIAMNAQRTVAQSSRQMSVISGPPQVRISPAEKAVHGAIIAFGIFAIPSWVLANIKNYRSR